MSSLQPAPRWPARLPHAAGRLVDDPAERLLAGRVSAILWIIGGLTLLVDRWLPGIADFSFSWDLELAAGALTWGLCSLFVIDWCVVTPRLLVASTFVSLIVVAAAVAATGGAASAAWICLFWIALYAAYFFEPPVAPAFVAGCLAVQALPLAYDSSARSGPFIAQLITAGTGYVCIGGGILATRSLLERLRGRAARVDAEQRALRRIATAVVGGDSADHAFALAAAEVAALLDADVGTIMQITSDGARVVGGWARDDRPRVHGGQTLPIPAGGEIERALLERRAVRTSGTAPESLTQCLGAATTIAAPITAHGVLWGVVAVGSQDADALRPEGEQELNALTELLATVVAGVEDRARLAAQALTDPLTGLANARALHQRLAAEAAGAARHARALSVVMLDVDEFKEINDRGGHEAGDDALRTIAGCLLSVARAEDTVGRAGGDEFMWILPETAREDALVAVERARSLIAASGSGPRPLNTSAGICDTRSTREPGELARLADVALYASKATGRNRATLYGPEVAVAFSARAEFENRAETLEGLRALARAIDAKDPATRQHSERVSALAGRLAEAAGWPTERVAQLREAALVHDVGKIGVPDAILRKPDRLDKAEWDQMRQHAELSARIVGSILNPEQVAWIEAHHERPDGGGYPRGLGAERIPGGAALIALADALDVMAAGRSYSARRDLAGALAECRALAGRQFTHEAVRALLRLQATGELDEALDLAR